MVVEAPTAETREDRIATLMAAAVETYESEAPEVAVGYQVADGKMLRVAYCPDRCNDFDVCLDKTWFKPVVSDAGGVLAHLDVPFPTRMRLTPDGVDLHWDCEPACLLSGSDAAACVRAVAHEAQARFTLSGAWTIKDSPYRSCEWVGDSVFAEAVWRGKPGSSRIARLSGRGTAVADSEGVLHRAKYWCAFDIDERSVVAATARPP